LPNIEEHFAHVLLFACPECERPLASACASSKKTWKKQTRTFSTRTVTADGAPGCRDGSSKQLGAGVARVLKPEAGAASPSDGSCGRQNSHRLSKLRARLRI